MNTLYHKMAVVFHRTWTVFQGAARRSGSLSAQIINN